MEEYIEYEVVVDTIGNNCSLQSDLLPIGTKFFGTKHVTRSLSNEGECINFRHEGNPTSNYFIPLKYLKVATLIVIGGE